MAEENGDKKRASILEKVRSDAEDIKKLVQEKGKEEVEALNKKGDVVVLDVRRPDEYAAFSIPGAVSVPGAEVVEYYPRLVPNDKMQVVVNCAGRTRGQIWAQALINAGVKNPVASLENGTIGWTLAGLPLSNGQQSQGFDTKSPNHFQPAEAALTRHG